MVPTTEGGWQAHVKGVSELIRRCEPHMLCDGINHSLFVGFRPLIVREEPRRSNGCTDTTQILQALNDRKSVFLSSEDWIKVPFSRHGATSMQALLSEAAVIPSLLESIDALRTVANSELPVAVSTLHDSLRRVLACLWQWEQMLIAAAEGRPLFWEVPSAPLRKSEHRLPAKALYFPDVSAANAYVHFWAFQIVCLTQLDVLRGYPTVPGTSVASDQDDEPLRKNIIALATNICQSMEYLMQDEMKLYGPASTFYALRIVYETVSAFRAAEAGAQIIEWCRGVANCLVKKGLGLATLTLREVP